MARNPTWTGSGSVVNVYPLEPADGYQLKISDDDTTPAFLEDKIAAGSYVTLSIVNDGGNEHIQISVTPGAGFADGYNVKASATDTSPDFLDQKLIARGLITLTLRDAGADEYIDIGITLDSYASTAYVDSADDLKADKTLLDAYLTYSEIDDYAKTSYVDSASADKADKSLLDAYLTYSEIDDYAKTSYVDSADDLKADLSLLDAYLTYSEIDDYAKTSYVDSADDLKADLSLLDAYLTYSEIDDYAKTSYVDAADADKADLSLLDAYLTYAEIDDYAKTSYVDSADDLKADLTLLDAYLTYSEIDDYAKTSYVDAADAGKADKTLLDAYLTYSEIDDYAKTSYVDSADDLKADKSLLDAYLTYSEIDDYAKTSYVDSADDLKADLSLLDSYLTYSEIDDYAKTSYVDSADDLKADKSLLDAYLTYSEIDDYAKMSWVEDGYAKVTHASEHISGGSDEIKLDDLASPDDNTDLNATTEKHGLLLKLGGGTTNYLRADGSWAEPPGGSGISYSDVDDYAKMSWVEDGYAQITHASEHASGGSDEVKLDDLASPDDNTDLNATTSAHGLLPKLDNDSGHFLNGQGSWATPAGGGGGLTYADIDDYGKKSLLDSYATTSHASDHIKGGDDEIDGDLIDVDFTPSNYTPTVASPASDVDHLTSHLKGIDLNIERAHAVGRSNNTFTTTVTDVDTWYNMNLYFYPSDTKNISLYSSGWIKFNVSGYYVLHFNFVALSIEAYTKYVRFGLNGTETYPPIRLNTAWVTDNQMLTLTSFFSADAGDDGYVQVKRAASSTAPFQIYYPGLVVYKIGA